MIFAPLRCAPRQQPLLRRRRRRARRRPLSPRLPVQPVLALAADPQARERIAAAITEAGGEPVHLEGLKELANATIPHRFIVFSWDGNEEQLLELSKRLRPGTQVVAVV